MSNNLPKSSSAYLKGGPKEACFVAKEFLDHASSSGKNISSESPNVNAEEFIKSVKTLIAFAYAGNDDLPEKWRCDSDCMLHSSKCLGMYNVDKDSDKQCPFFVDESLI